MCLQIELSTELYEAKNLFLRRKTDRQTHGQTQSETISVLHNITGAHVTKPLDSLRISNKSKKT